MSPSKVDLKNLTQDQLISFVESLGQPSFRGRQLLAWIYKPDITDFDQMTDLAKVFRRTLKNNAIISRFDQAIIENSSDGSVKFAFQLQDGKVIESVLIPENERSTLCISSQVGCAMGCTFCCTGKMGFGRNLHTSEIINQVCAVKSWAQTNKQTVISNLVFMGMGEPLANMDVLLDAISLFTEQRGLNFSARRITVSTCGLIPQMLQLGERTNVNLAISLHAVDDATRNVLMPVNRKYPLAQLIAACKKYPQKKRQRIMFEFTLIKGVNDNKDTAHRLAKLLHSIPCKINLLSMNNSGDDSVISPDRETVLHFQKILRDKGYPVFIRQSRGDDIAAACGQLAQKTWDPSKCTAL
ncbi:MAG: 23S rRNA (adenine(2503)-C(2))-methyltransferase RlmN [Desulfobulbus propionicus]|nr:MAG: 23S rRNA (adenine(2503)-C(2))-methyltransferase RlmN [Desulfobulbus propionicus]